MNRCAMGVVRSVSSDLRQAARALELISREDRAELAAMIGPEVQQTLADLDYAAGALTGAAMELSQCPDRLSVFS